MTNKSPPHGKSKTTKRAAPPDAAKLFPQIIRWEMITPEFGEPASPKRQDMFLELDNVGFSPSRPHGPNLAKSISGDWWFVAIEDEESRKMLLRILSRYKKIRVINMIQTVQHDAQHPLSIDRASLVKNMDKFRD